MEIHRKETESSFYRMRPGEGGGRVEAPRRRDEGGDGTRPPDCSGEVQIVKLFLSLWWTHSCVFFVRQSKIETIEKVSIVFSIALACSLILLACCLKLLLGQHLNWRPQFQDTIQHLRITSWASSGPGQITLPVGTWKMMIIHQKIMEVNLFQYSSLLREHIFRICHSPQLL